jgi:hypothetical protein
VLELGGVISSLWEKATEPANVVAATAAARLNIFERIKGTPRRDGYTHSLNPSTLDSVPT